MGNIVTAFFAFVACFFFHFRENNDKVPESSKNGPKKVPILPLRPEFCLCKDFLSKVPNPIFFFGAPGSCQVQILTPLILMPTKLYIGRNNCSSATDGGPYHGPHTLVAKHREADQYKLAPQTILNDTSGTQIGHQNIGTCCLCSSEP